MNNILVPVDFSEASSNALSYALQLFGKEAMSITLVHIFGARSTALMMKNIDGVLRKDAESQLDKLLKTYKADYPDVHFETKIRKNYPVDTIVQLSKTGDYNFIVMGTKGASGLKEVFMGSIAGGVVAGASTPTIVVPDNYGFKPLNDIVFAVSDQEIHNFDAIIPLRDLALKQQSKLVLLHVTQGEIPQLGALNKLLGDVDVKVDFAYTSGDVNTDINAYLKKHNSGLVCLLRGKKTFIDRLLNKSVTMKQTFNSPVPLMILHDE